jgi:hypothetical protein
LTAKSAKASANGASTIHVHATGDLTADASGASTIRYTGNPPDVKANDSGASSVKPKS